MYVYMYFILIYTYMYRYYILPLYSKTDNPAAATDLGPMHQPFIYICTYSTRKYSTWLSGGGGVNGYSDPVLGESI
jgi:hypothetical protein